MLKLKIPRDEGWDEEKEEFIEYQPIELELEHSLISLSKWESLHHKPFLDSVENNKLTSEEWLSYIRMMVLNEVDDSAFGFLRDEHIKAIVQYIEDPMTATWFSNDNRSKKKIGKTSATTSEIIYYWMVSLNIPFECQYWHLNRLLTLVRVCSEKNQPPKKKNMKETISQRKALNKSRRNALHSKG